MSAYRFVQIVTSHLQLARRNNRDKRTLLTSPTRGAQSLWTALHSERKPFAALALRTHLVVVSPRTVV